MNEKDRLEKSNFTIEELVEMFGSDQDSLNTAVMLALENTNEEGREEKIKQLKNVAEITGLKFPTEEDIQRKKAEFAADEISRN